MSIFTAKLLKIGGPIATGIGGVIATSFLVSKSAEEKEDEKFKTKSLSDEDPLIEEFKDQDENEQKENQDSKDNESGTSHPEATEKNESDESAASGSKQSESSSTSEGEGGSKQSDVDSEIESGDSSSRQDPKSELGSEAVNLPNGSDQPQEQGDSKDEEKVPEDDKALSEPDGRNDSSSVNGLEIGNQDAEHLNANANAYGTQDKAMTQQELEKVKSTRDDLQESLNKLTAMIQ